MSDPTTLGATLNGTKEHWQRRWIITVLIATGVVIVVAYVISFGIAGAELSERKIRMHQAALMLSAHWTETTLPSPVIRDLAGRPLVSWRFEAFLRTIPTPGIARMDLPWDHPANAYFTSRSPSHFCRDETNETSVFAVVGKGTAFDPDERFSIGDLDGDTIVLIEVHDSGVHWMAPGDLSIAELENSTSIQTLIGVPGHGQTGFIIGFADCEVWRMSYEVPIHLLKRYCLVESAKQHRREDDLAAYRISE